jgi:hypothetical protein
MKRNILKLFALFLFSFYLNANSAFGKDFDAYAGNGGYATINQAIESGAGEIMVLPGTYNEAVYLPEGTILTGSNRDRVIISGGLVMADGSKIENLTVIKQGIRSAPDADIIVENASVLNTANNSVEISGLGTLILKNSLISQSEKKGINVRWGGNVEITNSVISDNREEGIDLRGFVRGYIRGNEIKNNGESGLELVIGDSRLAISDNTFARNRSSGICAQYYSESPNKGNIYIAGNKFERNREYGLKCNIPSGGSAKKEYWGSSLNVSPENVFSDNAGGLIHERCSIDEENFSPTVFSIEEMEAEYAKEKISGDEKHILRKEIEGDVDRRLVELKPVFLEFNQGAEEIQKKLQKRKLIIKIFGVGDATLDEVRALRSALMPIMTESIDLIQMTIEDEKISESNTIYLKMLNFQIKQRDMINELKNAGISGFIRKMGE